MNNSKKVARKYDKSKKPQSYKGRRPQRRAHDVEADANVHSADAVNDVTYYIDSANSELVSQLNTFSFTEFAGVPVDMGTINGVNINYSVANIMQINVNPSAGYIDRNVPSNNGINRAALRAYTYFSAQNGKSTNYQANDVAMLLLAMGNIIAEFSHGARALGLTFTINNRNRSYPELAIKACGFDPADLIANKAQYLIDYNYAVQAFNKLPIPAGIKYFDKCAKMFSSIYLDEEGSSMAQSYAFVPYTGWDFDEQYSSTGSGLKTQPIGTLLDDADSGFRTCTFSSYLYMLNQQINHIATSATFNFIYSDILRLNKTGNMNLLQISEVPSNYAILPGKVEELSIWLNNATVVGLPNTVPATVGSLTYTASNDVVADVISHCVMYKPQFIRDWNATGFKFLVNFKHDAPSIEERIYSTRLLNYERDIAVTGQSYNYVTEEVSLGDWYVVDFRIACNNGPSWNKKYTANFMNYNSSQNGLKAYIEMCAKLTKFDWHPMIYWIDYSSGNEGVKAIIGDLQYYTTIDYNLSKKMNDTALLNLFSLV